MTSSHQSALKVLLRFIGTLCLLALIFVAVPYSCMNGIHQYLGMGELSHQPVVGYLARSTSAFYAILGVLFWLISFDLQRYARVVNYLGAIFVVFGAAFFIIDWVEGMPLFWRNCEGPFVIVFGIVIIYLNLNAKKKWIKSR
jgi:hypothetical protein